MAHRSQTGRWLVDEYVRIGNAEDAALLGSHDPNDFGRFYERHVGAVVAFLGRRVRGPDVVFDLTAETFARAFERRGQYDPARGPAVAWVLAIARNLLIDSVRRSRVIDESRLRLGVAPVSIDDAQLALIETRSRVDLRAVLGALPAEQSNAIIRRFLLEESYTEIAEQLSCSEQVVRKRVSRGLANARQAIGEQA
jgi:RNA polymerase sigma-70 factor (ECF subfamily)